MRYRCQLVLHLPFCVLLGIPSMRSAITSSLCLLSSLSSHGYAHGQAFNEPRVIGLAPTQRGLVTASTVSLCAFARNPSFGDVELH
jgi:hypothetical protein